MTRNQLGTWWVVAALGLATVVAALGIATKPAAAQDIIAQLLADARRGAAANQSAQKNQPQVKRGVKPRKSTRSRFSTRRAPRAAAHRGRPARVLMTPSVVAARAVPVSGDPSRFDAAFAAFASAPHSPSQTGVNALADASPIKPRAIATTIELSAHLFPRTSALEEPGAVAHGYDDGAAAADGIARELALALLLSSLCAGLLGHAARFDVRKLMEGINGYTTALPRE